MDYGVGVTRSESADELRLSEMKAEGLQQKVKEKKLKMQQVHSVKNMPDLETKLHYPMRFDAVRRRSSTQDFPRGLLLNKKKVLDKPDYGHEERQEMLRASTSLCTTDG